MKSRRMRWAVLGMYRNCNQETGSDEATWKTFAILNTQGLRVRVVCTRVQDKVQ
jgi:hypothetical protein